MYCAAGPPSGGLGIDWGMVGSLVGVFSARSSAKEPPCVSTMRSGIKVSSLSATGVWEEGNK